jgi:hypothetical protein
VLEDQSGYTRRKGRFCTDVFNLNQITEKTEFNMETHTGFIDPQKASDRAYISKLLEILDKRGYPTHSINILKSCD